MVNLSPVMPARISPTAAGSSSSGSGIRLIASPSPPRPGHSDEAWQASVRQLLWLAKSHLGANWPAFVATSVLTSTCWTCGAIRRDRARDLASRRAPIYPGQHDRPRRA